MNEAPCKLSLKISKSLVIQRRNWITKLLTSRFGVSNSARRLAASAARLSKPFYLLAARRRALTLQQSATVGARLPNLVSPRTRCKRVSRNGRTLFTGLPVLFLVLILQLLAPELHLIQGPRQVAIGLYLLMLGIPGQQGYSRNKVDKSNKIPQNSQKYSGSSFSSGKYPENHNKNSDSIEKWIKTIYLLFCAVDFAEPPKIHPTCHATDFSARLQALHRSNSCHIRPPRSYRFSHMVYFPISRPLHLSDPFICLSPYPFLSSSPHLLSSSASQCI